jgi:hypothetical protein
MSQGDLEGFDEPGWGLHEPSVTIRWRGRTFRSDPSVPGYNVWKSGRWKLERSWRKGQVLWQAIWVPSWGPIHATHDPTRPWDRLASLEALLKLLREVQLTTQTQLRNCKRSLDELEMDLMEP